MKKLMRIVKGLDQGLYRWFFIVLVLMFGRRFWGVILEGFTIERVVFGVPALVGVILLVYLRKKKTTDSED